MATFSPQARDNIKKLVLAFEELDDCFIGAFRDTVTAHAKTNEASSGTTISKTDLHTLESARSSYHASNYDLDDMIQYVQELPTYRKTWKSLTSSLLKAYVKTSKTEMFEWKFRLKSMQSAGRTAWQVAVPCTHEFAQIERDRLDIINGITDKFSIFDDFIDQIWFHIGETEKRSRFANEFQDTLSALIQMAQTGGPYMPLKRDDLLRVKNNIRMLREAEEAELDAQAVPVSKDTASKSEPEPTGSAPAVDSSPHKWDSTISAVVGLLVLFSSLLGYKAWEYSPQLPGTVKDADFWCLLQGSSMQLLGVLTIVLPLMQSNTLTFQSRTWTWIFVAISFACTVASVPLYLYVPTEWSSLLSFIGTAVQALVYSTDDVQYRLTFYIILGVQLYKASAFLSRRWDRHWDCYLFPNSYNTTTRKVIVPGLRCGRDFHQSCLHTGTGADPIRSPRMRLGLLDRFLLCTLFATI